MTITNELVKKIAVVGAGLVLTGLAAAGGKKVVDKKKAKKTIEGEDKNEGVVDAPEENKEG